MYLDMAYPHNKPILFLSMLYCNTDILSPLFLHCSKQPQVCIPLVFIHRVQMLWQHTNFMLHCELHTSFYAGCTVKYTLHFMLHCEVHTSFYVAL